MIQRIQSLFLLLAAVCAFSLFALPFASTGDTVATSSLFADSIYDIQDHVALIALFAAAGGLALISIFLFNNRKLQLMLGRFAIIANIIGIILVIVFFMNEKESLGAVNPDDGLGIYPPILFIVFGILALRYIGKDENLVKSMDRLR